MEAVKLSSAQRDAQDRGRRAAALLARALPQELNAAWDALEPKPEWQALRGPETGLVMVRGRIGGGGAPFNLGEATVSRATVRLSSGTVGHSHALGTDREKARLAAIFDAYRQEPAEKVSWKRICWRRSKHASTPKTGRPLKRPPRRGSNSSPWFGERTDEYQD